MSPAGLQGIVTPGVKQGWHISRREVHEQEGLEENAKSGRMISLVRRLWRDPMPDNSIVARQQE